jgi:dTDP-4-dehydrorhamnose reductase
VSVSPVHRGANSQVGRVLVAGAAGQLGAAIVAAFADREVIAYTRATLDVTDDAAVRAAVAAARPDVIVNCTSFNDVDGAEDRPIEAFEVNAFAVRSLARAAEAAGARLVHYSTDFVFDGNASSPYDEAATPAPKSTYAASKLTGEWFACDAPGTLVLRVESLFGTGRAWPGRRGTMDALVAGLEQGRRVRVFTDRTVSPSYTVDVAAATRHLVDTGAAPGLYHCVNSGQATWEGVARELARQIGAEPALDLITMESVAMKAARPRFCALANGKIAAAGYPMPPWQDAVARWLAARGTPADAVGSETPRYN